MILVWGLGPPISKLITAPAVISVLYRFWLSVPIIYALAVMRGVRPTWESVRHAVLAGAAFGINLVFVFLTINEGAVAVLSVFAAMQPGIILLIAGPFLGERPTVWHVVWTFIGIGGTAIVVASGGDGFEVSAGRADLCRRLPALLHRVLLADQARTQPARHRLGPMDVRRGRLGRDRSHTVGASHQQLAGLPGNRGLGLVVAGNHHCVHRRSRTHRDGLGPSVRRRVAVVVVPAVNEHRRHPCRLDYPRRAPDGCADVGWSGRVCCGCGGHQPAPGSA